MLGEVARSSDVTIDPGSKDVTIATDRVPRDVEVVVSVVVPVRVGRMSATSHFDDDINDPVRKHNPSGPGLDPIHDLLHRHK